MKGHVRFSVATLVALSAGPINAAVTLPWVLLEQNGSIAAVRGRNHVRFERSQVCFDIGGNRFSAEFLGAARVLPSGAGNGPRVHLFRQASAESAPVLSAVRYRSLYPGIDLVYRGEGRNLKSEYRIAPGADLRRIRIRYNGAENVLIRQDGSLRISFAAATIEENAPLLYQIRDGRQAPVRGGFRLSGPNQISFWTGEYDARLPLVIDPYLVFSKVLGGSGESTAAAMTRDASGNLYVAGWTAAPDFAVTSGSRSRSGGVDAFVLKLDGSSHAVVYAVYLGGSMDDRATGIAVDASGNVYVTGSTSSPDFPAIGAQQPSLGGGQDAFLAKLDPSGATLRFSTYFGGSGTDTANAIALHPASGDVLIAGETHSADLPVVKALQPALKGASDAFAARFTSQGSIVYATYLGGGSYDRALGIAVDTAGNAYLAGSTDSLDFPVLNALQPLNAGGQDAFVTKLNAAGSALVYSTYLGGSSGSSIVPEAANAITVDLAGNAYVAGTTPSPNFPVFGAAQPLFGGYNADAFVSKLSASGSSLVFSTFLGGSALDSATAIKLDPSGSAVVGGYTLSADFPLVWPVQSLAGGRYDIFITRFSASGNQILFSTYFGGRGTDAAFALDVGNDVAFAGQTWSTDLFPGAGAGDVLIASLQTRPTTPPFGSFDTPTNNSPVVGAVAVTGWALDSIQVTKVDIWREPLAGEPVQANGMVYLGDAVQVAGARPDVQAAYPSYPYNDRAGWGYMLLTNLLPSLPGLPYPGNGTYRLHAIAHNIAGQTTDLGTHIITVNNARATNPFGTIDTPSQGGTVSGTQYVNFGWVLTAQPAKIPLDGSTITVYIDNAPVGHPSYNNYRGDIATLFPGYANSGGAVGIFVIDTTQLANGTHSIAWGVTDSAGHAAGIGSRNFFVQN